MDELKVENVPLHVIPVTEYDPFEVCVITLVLIELKLRSVSYTHLTLPTIYSV